MSLEVTLLIVKQWARCKIHCFFTCT